MGTMLVCSPATQEPGVRAVLGSFVKFLRNAAPALEIHDVPIDHLPFDVSPGPRVAIPLTLSDHDAVAHAVRLQGSEESGLLAAQALGPDWLLAELCVRRLVHAGAHPRDTIVMGVAGSDDPDVISDYSRAAQLLSAVWGGPVHLGSVDGSDTPLADAIDIARAYGRRVVIASYVLTPGGVSDQFRAAGADLVTAPILDGATPDRRLIRLILERCEQALGVVAPST